MGAPTFPKEAHMTNNDYTPVPDARLCHDDAEALLAINASLHSPSPEWVHFLSETLSHWLVEQRAPQGVVDEAKARWLIERIDEGDRRPHPAALAVLRRCCVIARDVPRQMLQYLRMQEARPA